MFQWRPLHAVHVFSVHLHQPHGLGKSTRNVDQSQKLFLSQKIEWSLSGVSITNENLVCLVSVALSSSGITKQWSQGREAKLYSTEFIFIRSYYFGPRNLMEWKFYCSSKALWICYQYVNWRLQFLVTDKCTNIVSTVGFSFSYGLGTNSDSSSAPSTHIRSRFSPSNQLSAKSCAVAASAWLA